MYAPLTDYIPQTRSDRRPLLMWIALTAVALLLIGMVIAAPLAHANQQTFFAAAVYQTFSHICHQQPERSFFIAGKQFAVCARCTGIYAGFAAAALCYPLLTSLRRTTPPDRKWLVIAAFPLAVDFGLGFLGIWENTHSSRFLTGALLGSVAVFYVMPGLAELSQMLGSRPAAVLRTSYSPNSPQEQERISAAPSDYSAPFRRI